MKIFVFHFMLMMNYATCRVKIRASRKLWPDIGERDEKIPRIEELLNIKEKTTTAVYRISDEDENLGLIELYKCAAIYSGAINIANCFTKKGRLDVIKKEVIRGDGSANDEYLPFYRCLLLVKLSTKPQEKTKKITDCIGLTDIESVLKADFESLFPPDELEQFTHIEKCLHDNNDMDDDEKMLKCEEFIKV